MLFAKLDDSPMFRQEIQQMEENAELLKASCLKFYKGSRKYTEGLGEGYDCDMAFVNALETFIGGYIDPICVAFGDEIYGVSLGPEINKFTIALREIGTYKEVLRSQIEHMLNDRLLHIVSVELHDIKRFENWARNPLKDSKPDDCWRNTCTYYKAKCKTQKLVSIKRDEKKKKMSQALIEKELEDAWYTPLPLVKYH